MPTIYQIGPKGYWTGATQEIGEMDGAPPSWTRSPVPTLANGEFAIWTGQWTKTTVDPDYVPFYEKQANLKAAITAKRYEVETGGVDLGGSKIQTDRESQAMISGAYAYAQTDANLTIDFKGSNGWVTLTSPQMIAIGTAVAQHVQACFSREKELHNAVDAATEQTIDSIDINVGWPGQ